LLLRLGLGLDLVYLAPAIELLEEMLWAMGLHLLLHRLDQLLHLRSQLRNKLSLLLAAY